MSALADSPAPVGAWVGCHDEDGCRSQELRSYSRESVPWTRHWDAPVGRTDAFLEGLDFADKSAARNTDRGDASSRVHAIVPGPVWSKAGVRMREEG